MANAKMTRGQCAALACILEATAAKPGNVHRGADFDDMSYVDLLTSATAIVPAMEEAQKYTLGKTVLHAIRATRQVTHANTNLGIILLLAPLASVPDDPLEGVKQFLEQTSTEDARDVFAAIRQVSPGGLGRDPRADVAAEPSIDLVAAMRLASERDLVARQYAGGFCEVRRAADWIEESLSESGSLAGAIVRGQLRLLSEFPDSLIMRKCGPETAKEASDRAATLLSLGRLGDEAYEKGLADYDFWLRADGHRRNPGTSADLICAALFVLLRRGRLPSPFSFYGMNSV